MREQSASPGGSFCGRTRREFLWQAGAGFTALGLTSLLSQDGFLASQAKAADGATPYQNPLAPKPPHFAPKAKSVIFLFMYGGPSHVDTFDYKPKLYDLDGKTIQIKTKGRGGSKNEGRVVGPKWKFKQYGKCGKYVSELFPNVATCVDDIAFIHSLTADSPIHGSAMLQMNSGKILSGSPCMGSWVNYGLGSFNENLPGFVVMLDPKAGPISGAKNWSSGYMPAVYQGTVLRSAGAPILDLETPDGITRPMQRELLDTLRDYNAEHHAARVDNSALAARISSYELAYKMQSSSPEATDIDREPEEIKEMYGLNEKRTASFARRCIMARRLVERGVRFVQVYSGGAHNDDNWDCARRPGQEPHVSRGKYRQAGGRSVKGFEAHGIAGFNAGDLGRRVRAAADGRIQRRNRPRPQRVWLHDVDGRWGDQGRRERGRNG